ncbi:hypothetical protein D7Y54_00405 [Stenotrophomonas maltophilia]|nr:hypothetical protein [Stenotrophomonas maltophilia]
MVPSYPILHVGQLMGDSPRHLQGITLDVRIQIDAAQLNISVGRAHLAELDGQSAVQVVLQRLLHIGDVAKNFIQLTCYAGSEAAFCSECEHSRGADVKLDVLHTIPASLVEVVFDHSLIDLPVPNAAGGRLEVRLTATRNQQ